ncbi:GNAT family N-acetyltransferase [Mucilaginibacter sp. UR6-1]|uniref:GNAT family N-acetyltransferase n=1 Tax=Mucilaginibacter sp. UR6-1 TaxID=1435643 RepID=UPI001E547D07|nr:GNAT family N-acetyltransferase [Mucilaginibacter sp. UR6-1]MCC8408296.1 GNAT family N-acetyltransferase [Mucilaginibacter sp. UR6-1]
MANIIIETERLVLRELTLNDAGFILALLNTPGWLTNVGDRNVHTIADAEKYLQGPIKSYADYGLGLWAVTLKVGDSAIGLCGLIKRNNLEDIDIGYALFEEHSGRGYAFEAADAVVKKGFTDFGLKRIVAITIPQNARSRALLGKLNFTLEKEMYMAGDKQLLQLYSLNKQ